MGRVREGDTHTHPDWTQQKIAEHSGVSRQYVHKVLSTEKFESNQTVDIPHHLNGSHERADFRKLPPELQQARKKILEVNGKERYEKTVGRPSKDKSLSTFDNDKHNTQQVLARRVSNVDTRGNETPRSVKSWQNGTASLSKIDKVAHNTRENDVVKS